MPLRPIDKSADEHGDRNEVQKDPQQILDQVVGSLPGVPARSTPVAGPTAELPAQMFAATALSQPPETTAADDNALRWPTRHARRQRLSPTARRRSDKPGAADGHGSRIGEPSNNRAVGNTRNA